MKRLMMHSVFAAAALVAIGGSAKAQVLSADIPFAFRAGGSLMQPGSYQLLAITSGGARVFELYNRDTRQSALMLHTAQTDAAKDWVRSGTPKIEFQCVASQCGLHQIWTGDGPAYSYPVKLGDGAVRVTEIRVISLKTD